MSKISIGVLNSEAGLVCDEQYYQIVRLLCLRAYKRIFASIFIVDILPFEENNEKNLTANLLQDLRRACSRGVDVRIIIGGSKQNPNIQDICESAMVHCQRLKIPCQLMTLRSTDSSHKKLIVIDDHILIGSHNWSNKAFSGEIQDSVLVKDPRLASYFADELAIEWRLLLKEAKNATV